MPAAGVVSFTTFFAVTVTPDQAPRYAWENRVAEAIHMIEKPSSDKIDNGSQAEVKNKRRASNGQSKLITHKVELHLPHSIYTEIQEESDVW